MIDINYCMSSYLAFRYIIDDNKDFFNNTKHRLYKLVPEEMKNIVSCEKDIDIVLKKTFSNLNDLKLGILLSGGMDSACLASYMKGADAYTFRFLNGNYQTEELKRAEYYAYKWNLNLHYVDIDWNTVLTNLDTVIKQKGAPVHSIEPQILAAAKQAKLDGIDKMIIGDAADYIFGGMDSLYSKDWKYNDFKKRYIYVQPNEVLKEPIDMDFAFREYKKDDSIDYITFMHKYTDIESYSSYENAFFSAKMDYLDPYESLKMAKPLDLSRIRNGEPKYLIRNLFRMKYPEMPIPQKLPMPRPVDEYFKNWQGPKRNEFKDSINIQKYSGNQKWLIWCLEHFLNMYAQ